MAAKIRGANPIIGIDIVADRLPIALELGATHAVCYDLQRVVSQVKDLCGGNGTA
jgi:Zn-dependent alcohol dehydrogenase